MTWLRGLLIVVSMLAGASIAVVFLLGPQWVHRNTNQVSGDSGRAPTPETRALHTQLIVGDLHADSALWGKDLLHRNKRGQVDLPHLIEGGASLQMFTSVTKSPQGQNYEKNATDTADNITLLAIAQRWPAATFDSLLVRAMLQADRVWKAAAQSPHLTLITSQSEHSQLLAPRGRGEAVVGALLGTEGSHALDGQLDDIDLLCDAGFRMMGLHHFFDNGLAGSLHRESQGGLTPFGEQVVRNMQKKGIMIDVAHSSETTVRDTVRATAGGALIVSHTGFDRHCPSPRNISDETMALITEAGGLIGVGFWADVTCGESVAAIASAIQYGVERFGVDHIALGSERDGSVTTPTDAAQLPHLTQALLDAGLTQTEVRAVTGRSMAHLPAQHLPPG